MLAVTAGHIDAARFIGDEESAICNFIVAEDFDGSRLVYWCVICRAAGGVHGVHADIAS